ncbi:hypothetical protein [Helicobacter muridarum]|uniref:hypothetical protein n=1 Tax=Helicobacter muridarum TaxID=216 RepID=UPI001F223C10|nr:hypothetical protein [Helicobacter muridarum]
MYYVWIAVFANNEDLENAKIHYYIFHSSDVRRFDDISLPTYQITDNQKTTLRINLQGEVCAEMFVKSIQSKIKPNLAKIPPKIPQNKA